MNKPTAVNMTGSQTSYGIKHDNIEIGNVTNDYANNNGGLTWYNSPDTAGKYVIFSAANDNGFMTPTPLFWVCDQVDEDLITIVNGLPGRRGETPFTNALDAKDWLTSSPVYYLSEDGGTTPTGFTITVTESGGNVVWDAYGVLNINDLAFAGDMSTVTAGYNVGSAVWVVGSTTPNAADLYTGTSFNVYASSLGPGPASGGPSSGSGLPFGIVQIGSPSDPRMVLVPDGYVSGSLIDASTTYNGQTIASMGLTEGTYTYSWGTGPNAQTVNMVIGNSGTGGGGGGTGTWYFYSDEGNLNAGPPIGNGNAIFITSGQPIVETFNPNAASGLKLLFNLNDSTGTDYTAQFTNQVGPGGKITITQNGNYAAYQYTVPGSIFIENGPAGTWAIIETSVALQAANASGSFNFNDPITLTFTL